MLAYTLAFKPCSEVTNIGYLSLFGSCLWLPKQNPNLFWRDFGKKAKDIEISRKLNSIGLTYKLLS